MEKGRKYLHGYTCSGVNIFCLDFEVAETGFGSVLNLCTHNWDHNQLLTCNRAEVLQRWCAPVCLGHWTEQLGQTWERRWRLKTQASAEWWRTAWGRISILNFLHVLKSQTANRQSLTERKKAWLQTVFKADLSSWNPTFVMHHKVFEKMWNRQWLLRKFTKEWKINSLVNKMSYTQFTQDMVIAIFFSLNYLIFQGNFRTKKEAYQKLFTYTRFDCQMARESHSEEWTTVSQILASFPL